MPDAKRPDPKRRSPRPRPGRGGESARERPKSTASRREPRSAEREPRPSEARAEAEPPAESINASIAAAAARQSEQRLGFTARRAAILAGVICVLTLTIAGPVRTYFAQRTEMKQLTASEAALREQIANLEQQKEKLNDPVFIAAQARERLGFVKPGDTPYQVQLPPGAVTPTEQEAASAKPSSNDPWYTSLWRTIADKPHNIPPATAPTAPAPDAVEPPPPPGPPPPPPGG